MKPDDVPQWAWDEAEEPAQACFDASVDLYETGMETANVQLIVARAILQARSLDFEECAKIAEGNRVAREMTLYDIDKIIEQGTIMDQHWLVQELAFQRLKQVAGVVINRGWEFNILKTVGAYEKTIEGKG